jgi:hypothetical protein
MKIAAQEKVTEYKDQYQTLFETGQPGGTSSGDHPHGISIALRVAKITFCQNKLPFLIVFDIIFSIVLDIAGYLLSTANWLYPLSKTKDGDRCR